jgi:hypothetical protein
MKFSSIPPIRGSSQGRCLKRKRPGDAGAFSKRFERTAYFVAGAEEVVVVVVVEVVLAVAASGAMLVVLVVVVLVSSTTLGASTLTSVFLSSGLLQATSDAARATRARADVNFFISGYSLM